MSLLLKANNIHVEYMDRVILHIPTVELYTNDRIGIVGNIGAGKTTLLQALSGAFKCPGCRVQAYGEIAYLRQIQRVQPEAQTDAELLRRLAVHNLSPETMSGGEAIRYRIANLLSRNVHCILADEPTCNVDREGIDFLIDRFNRYEGALVIVSHDRYFLDAVVHKIWELKDGELTEYCGNYSDYQCLLEENLRNQESRHSAYIKELARLTNAYEVKKEKAKAASKKPDSRSGKNNIPDKNGMTKSFDSREKTLHRSANQLLTRINHLDRVESPEAVQKVRFFSSGGLSLHHRFPIWGEGIDKAYGEQVLFANASFHIPLGAKVAITGRNGSGKTTLLQMIIGREKGIFVSPKAAIGYYLQNGYDLLGDDPLLQFVSKDCAYKESVLRSMLASLGFAANDLKKRMSSLSGGERAKSVLCKVFAGRYNILLLDEPSTYLDLKSVLALEGFIRDYPGTIVFVSHDRRLVDRAADLVYSVENCKLQVVKDRG